MKWMRELIPPVAFLVIAIALGYAGPRVVRNAHHASLAHSAHSARSAAVADPMLQQYSVQFENLAKAVKPSVAHISVLALDGTILSHGSGWIYDTKGHIVTCAHVVQQGQQGELYVQLADQANYPATLIGIDTELDIALLSVECRSLPPLPLSQDPPVQGQVVMAFGSPLGYSFSMSHGLISALNRSLRIDNRQGEHCIQVDVPVNPGSSGGPLCDTQGRVTGMMTAIASRDDRWYGVGLAIPVNIVQRVADELITTGTVSHGLLGVSTSLSYSSDPPHLPIGVTVDRILPNSAAANAGIQTGDLITSFNGQPLQSTDSLGALVATLPVGASVKLDIKRDNQTLTINATLDSRTPSQP